MSNPFEYVNEISFGKTQIIVDDLTEKAYVPFIANRALSYHADSIMHVNEMNRLHGLDNKMQFDYLMHSLRKKKRFSKWAKRANTEALDVIKEYYKVGDAKAEEINKVLTVAQISVLKERLAKGG